jgi:hypothetical protein
MNEYRVVFDGLPPRLAGRLGPLSEKLTYAITFEATTLEEARSIADGAAEVWGPLGGWHVEPVEDAA